MARNKEKGAIIEGGKIKLWVSIAFLGLGKMTPCDAIEGIETTEEEIEDFIKNFSDEILKNYRIYEPSAIRTSLTFDATGINMEAVQVWKPESSSHLPSISDWLKKRGLLKYQR